MTESARWIVTWTALDTALVALLLAAVAWGVWRDRRARFAMAPLSLLLRLALVVWLAAALAGAELWHETTAERPGNFVLLSDRSASTQIRPEVAGVLAAAEAQVQAALVGAGSTRHFAYVGRSQPDPWQPVTATVVAGGPTRMVADLARLPMGIVDGASGIVLFADGADSSVEVASPVTLPIAAVVLTPPYPLPRPLWLTDVATDAYALVRSPLRVRVEAARAPGGPSAARLTVRSRGAALATTTVVFAPGATTAAVALDVLPTVEGHQVLAVELDDGRSEIVPQVQRTRVAVRVIRDRTRVLHVVGRPDWESRLLRQSLRQDSTVDLVSFQILRTREDNPAAAEDDLSLIPFPTKELFTTELAKFDVVIFQNFDYRPYFDPAFRLTLLDNLRKFVLDDGGGFLMTAGDLSFGYAGYQRTPLADILPVVWDGFGTWLSRPIAAGPWLEWFGAPLPQHIAAVDRVYAAEPVAGARVVWRSDDRPAVVVARRGQGRSAAVLSDRLWRAPVRGDAGDTAALAQMWSRLVRYLSGDPAFEDMHVHWESSRVAPGGEARGRVTPAQAGQARLVDEAGRTVASVRVDAAGRFRARLPVTAATVLLAVGERVAPEPLIVELPLEERTAIGQNRAAWQAWADAHGALLLDSDNATRAAEALRAGSRRVVERTVQSVLDLMAYWLVGLALLLGELSVRRLGGAP